ncbi:ABC transporter ATP-binding protein [Marinobacter piscensis]|uniref:ABC transporter ATP-binding protein n=1 Tax=Marinobacter piscensis TaxID=1562308 RepID=UPI0011A4E70B|nr:ABC transporter ATP-binding protein [Marinobacter piscensis]
MSILQTRDLAIGYHGQALGTVINLAIHPGEVVSLLGPNGSGKTTLFRTLLGVLPPVSGQVLAGGRSLQQWPQRKLANLLGYVPQAHTGLFAFTVEDVVLMGRTARLKRFGAPSARDRHIAQAMLERMGAGHLAKRRFTEISGGQRQLALIARALAQEVSLLIMDEPTASLDFGNQLKTLDAIEQLRNEGLSVLISTHQPEHALTISDRIALIRDGELKAIGPAQETVTPASLATLYDVAEHMVAGCFSNAF